MTKTLDFTPGYDSRRPPMLGHNAVATSQPLAAQAGMKMLQLGGNAVDAAIATAMALNADATEKVISVQEMHAQITK